MNRNSFERRLLGLLLPIAFSQFMLALVSASDAWMLGRLSQDALSAVSLATQVTFVFNLFLAAMTIGTSMFAAQYWGRQDIDAMERLLGYSLRISTLVSFGFTLASLVVPAWLMRIFTNDAELISQGVSYLRMAAFSYLFCGISQIYLCILKNSGHVTKSMVIGSVTVLINIVLNAVLIFGLLGFSRFGIVGAALATTIARAIELAWTLLVSRKNDHVHIHLGHVWQKQTHLGRRFWKYTSPVLANELIWGLGFAMYSVIMGHLGSDAVAANSIASIVKSLLACLCVGLGNGGGILVGNELGAGNLEQARVYGRKLWGFAFAVGVVTCCVLAGMIPAVLSVTSLSLVSETYLRGMLLICCLNLVGKAVTTTMIDGVFCAGGDSRFGMKMDAVVMWCICVPLGLLAAFVLKLPVVVVYAIVSMDELLKVPAVYFNYKRYRWVKRL